MTVGLHFKTDFTWLLDKTARINHIVKVITKDTILECSGVILSQHSDVLRRMIAEDSELYLNNYTQVQDCLTILHGGRVELQLENIHDIMKFSVQFGIEELYEQCLQWIEDNISAENLGQMFVLCNGISKFSKFDGLRLKSDVFEPVASYLRIKGKGAMQSLIDDNMRDDDMGNLIQFIFGSRALFIPFAEMLLQNISKDNIDELLPILSKHPDILKNLSHDGFDNLLSLIDTVISENEHYAPYSGLTGKIALKYMQNIFKESFHVPHFISNVSGCWVDGILSRQCWKSMNVDQLATVQSVFKTPSQHFLYSEMVLAWVIEKKPDQEIVSYITQSLLPFHFDADYMTMLGRQYEALGYLPPIPQRFLDMCPKPAHYIETNYGGALGGSQFRVNSQIKCRAAQPCRILHPVFNIDFVKGTQPNRTSWRWAKAPPSKHFLTRCPKITQSNNDDGDMLFFYGVTEDNVHLPINTSGIETVNGILARGKNVITLRCILFPAINEE